MTDSSDMHNGIIHLLAIAASGLRTARLEYVPAVIEANAEGIAIDLSVAAENNALACAILDTMISAARGDLNAH